MQVSRVPAVPGSNLSQRAASLNNKLFSLGALDLLLLDFVRTVKPVHTPRLLACHWLVSWLLISFDYIIQIF